MPWPVVNSKQATAIFKLGHRETIQASTLPGTGRNRPPPFQNRPDEKITGPNFAKAGASGISRGRQLRRPASLSLTAQIRIRQISNQKCAQDVATVPPTLPEAEMPLTPDSVFGLPPETRSSSSIFSSRVSLFELVMSVPCVLSGRDHSLSCPVDAAT